jgi:hypothetical protein
MIFKKLDLFLRDYWAFWDTHGSRLTHALQAVYSVVAAVYVAVRPNTTVAAALLAGGGVFGMMGRARSQNTVEIMAAKNTPAP